MTTLREAIEFLQNRLRTECEYCDLAYLCDHANKKCTFLESLEIAIKSMTIRTLDNALDKGKQKDEEVRMLTDAEKAILRLTIIKDLFDDLSVNSNCVSVLLNREDELALKTAIKTLKEQRPHGEWIDKGEYAECSICGSCSGTQFDGVEPIPLKTNFCPNCGSDNRPRILDESVDGEGKDGNVKEGDKE